MCNISVKCNSSITDIFIRHKTPVLPHLNFPFLECCQFLSVSHFYIFLSKKWVKYDNRQNFILISNKKKLWDIDLTVSHYFISLICCLKDIEKWQSLKFEWIPSQCTLNVCFLPFPFFWSASNGSTKK